MNPSLVPIDGFNFSILENKYYKKEEEKGGCSMYTAKLIENKSERLIGKVDRPFFVPIQLIELKLNANSLESAINLAKRKLDPIINNPANLRIEQQTHETLQFSFRNSQDGLKVTYQLEEYYE